MKLLDKIKVWLLKVLSGKPALFAVCCCGGTSTLTTRSIYVGGRSSYSQAELCRMMGCCRCGKFCRCCAGPMVREL